MKTLPLEVEAVGGALLVHEMFGSVKSGSKVTLPGDAELELRSIFERKSFDFSSSLEFALQLSGGVGASLVAAWLYDKFKGRARTLRIDRVEVTMNKDEIKKILIERIESKE